MDSLRSRFAETTDIPSLRHRHRDAALLVCTRRSSWPPPGLDPRYLTKIRLVSHMKHSPDGYSGSLDEPPCLRLRRHFARAIFGTSSVGCIIVDNIVISSDLHEMYLLSHHVYSLLLVVLHNSNFPTLSSRFSPVLLITPSDRRAYHRALSALVAKVGPPIRCNLYGGRRWDASRR